MAGLAGRTWPRRGSAAPSEALRARPSPGTGQVSVPPLKAAAGTGRPPRLHGASRYRASPVRSIPGPEHPSAGTPGRSVPREGATLSLGGAEPQPRPGGSRACTHPTGDSKAWVAQTLPKTRSASCFAPDGTSPGEERPPTSPCQPELGVLVLQASPSPAQAPQTPGKGCSREHPGQRPPCRTRGWPGPLAGAGKGVQGHGGAEASPALLTCSTAQAGAPLHHRRLWEAGRGTSPAHNIGDRDRVTRAPSFAPACGEGGRKEGEFAKQ